MSERDKKAYDLAAEVVKQILGLSTAIVAVTATLLKDVIPISVPYSWTLIVAAWVLLIVSIGYGLSSLRWLTTKMYGPDDVRLPSLNDNDIVSSARWHVRAFVSALVLIVLFGLVEVGGTAFGFTKTPPRKSEDCRCR